MYSSYDTKVDIYSLGIILFEMYHTMETAHEKNKILKDLR
jgi:serine/threonine protein kinase